MTRWKWNLTAAPPLARTGPVLSLLGAGTLVAELSLAIYQFGIFGWADDPFHIVDRPAERALFFAALVVSHLLMLLLAWQLFRLIFRRRNAELRLLEFVFLFGTLFAISLVARTKLTAILGAALTVPLIRGLGGGGLGGALVYALLEAGFVLWIAGGAALLYLAARIMLRPGGAAPGAAPIRRIGSGKPGPGDFWSPSSCSRPPGIRRPTGPRPFRRALARLCRPAGGDGRRSLRIQPLFPLSRP